MQEIDRLRRNGETTLRPYLATVWSPGQDNLGSRNTVRVKSRTSTAQGARDQIIP